MRKITAIILIIAITTIGLGGCAAPHDALRLHIVANSDSVDDQIVKLSVRDSVMTFLSDCGFETRESAESFIAGNLATLTQIARDTLAADGFSYGAECSLGEFDFPDREYGGKVYPAGRYEALRITLGSGEGQNWWCVIFPPLCVVSASEYRKIAKKGVSYKSYVAELLRGMCK